MWFIKKLPPKMGNFHKESVMKNTIKWFGIMAFIAVIEFSMAGCKMDNDEEMLDGVWDRGDIVITFNNDVGVFTDIKSDSGDWLTSLNSGLIHIGDKKFRNITKTGDLKWSCQELINPNGGASYIEWKDGTTIAISANGKTLSVTNSSISYPTTTYTKK
jgi:hypothetical protein